MARCSGERWDGSCDSQVRGRGMLCGRCKKCRAATLKDKPCRNPGKPPGDRCDLHRDDPLWVPKSARPRSATRPRVSVLRQPSPTAARSLRRTRRVSDDHLRELADMCGEALASGGDDAIAAWAAPYSTDESWRKLALGRPKRNCRELAKLAREILDAKDYFHRKAGSLTQRFLELTGLSPVGAMFAGKLVEKLPYPGDLQVVAVARALHITGVWLCFAGDRDLMKCECLQALAKEEVKTRIKK